MHRCLLIHEILASIAQYLLWPADLLAMALTCQMFHAVAMDNLWHTVRNELKFIRLLPDGIVKVQKTVNRYGLKETRWVCLDIRIRG